MGLEMRVDAADRTGTHKGKWGRDERELAGCSDGLALKRYRRLNDSVPVTLLSRSVQITRTIRNAREIFPLSRCQMSRVFFQRASVEHWRTKYRTGAPTIARRMKLNVISSGIHAGNDLEYTRAVRAAPPIPGDDRSRRGLTEGTCG